MIYNNYDCFNNPLQQCSEVYIVPIRRNLDRDYTVLKIKTVYCHVASTWNLDVVAYIIHTYIYIHKYTYIHSDTQSKFRHAIAKIS